MVRRVFVGTDLWDSDAPLSTATEVIGTDDARGVLAVDHRGRALIVTGPPVIGFRPPSSNR